MKLTVTLLLLMASACYGADHVWLTIYNQNYAVVRDTRSFALTVGNNEVRFDNLSPMILDAPIRISGEGIAVLEQTFRYDHPNNDQLLKDNLGNDIDLLLSDTGITRISGKLIGIPRTANSDERYLIQRADGSFHAVLSRNIVDFHYPDSPQKYFIKPVLSLQLTSTFAETRELEAAYETQGLDWYARYLLDLSGDDSSAIFSGCAVVYNASGRSYDHVRITLVSNQTQRTQKQLRSNVIGRKSEYSREDRFRREDLETRAVSPIKNILEPQGKGKVRHFSTHQTPLVASAVHEQLFGLQTYAMPFETSLPENVEKELNLFAPTTIKTSSSYEYAWWQSEKKVGVYVETVNTDSSGLGVPLPAGPIEIYRMRAGNVPEYVGEERLSATDVNEPVRIRVGSAEGLVVNRTLLKEATRAWGKRDETWEVRIKNERETDVQIKIQERFQTKWKILASSMPYKEVTKSFIEFPVTIQPDSEVVVTYEKRVWDSPNVR